MGIAGLGIIDNHDDVVFIAENPIKGAGFFLIVEDCKQVE